MHLNRASFAILGFVAAFSLHASAAPSKNGPSLPATMQFIQDKLTDSGTVSFVVSTTDGTRIAKDNELINFRGDPQTCILSWRKRFGVNHVMYDYQLQLRDAQDVTVEPLKSAWTKAEALAGNFDAVSSVTPEITDLIVRLQHPRNTDDYYEFLFVDADLADRVARAIVHAIELCGGGSKDPF
jgi:hypothetical protein